MECDKCGDRIQDGDYRKLHGQTLCEDCYMDALSPARACDPWAVHSAKSFIKNATREPELTARQTQILHILRETGGADVNALLEKLQIKRSELEREIASLRHMEKVRGELREGHKVLCLWEE
jgi:hypothetical protein